MKDFKEKKLESMSDSKFENLSKSELRCIQGGKSTNVSIITHIPGTGAGTFQTAVTSFDSQVDTVAVDDTPQGTVYT